MKWSQLLNAQTELLSKDSLKRCCMWDPCPVDVGVGAISMIDGGGLRVPQALGAGSTEIEPGESLEISMGAR